MLMADDGVVESGRRCVPDRLQVGNNLSRAFPRITRLEQDRLAGGSGALDEGRLPPADVDDVDLEILSCCGEDEEKADQKHTKPERVTSKTHREASLSCRSGFDCNV